MHYKGATMPRKVHCPKCGNDNRSSDFSIPCDLCGAKKYPIIGYQYQKDARDIHVTIALVSSIVLLALCMGVVFLVYTQLQLM